VVANVGNDEVPKTGYDVVAEDTVGYDAAEKSGADTVGYDVVAMLPRADTVGYDGVEVKLLP
jgi:hypothetical protein